MVKETSASVVGKCSESAIGYTTGKVGSVRSDGKNQAVAMPIVKSIPSPLLGSVYDIVQTVVFPSFRSSCF